MRYKCFYCIVLYSSQTDTKSTAYANSHSASTQSKTHHTLVIIDANEDYYAHKNNVWKQ